MTSLPDPTPQGPAPFNEDTAPDWLLQVLVSVVNTSPLPIPITVNVGGMFITGYLASGKEYFAAFADQFTDEFLASLGADHFEGPRRALLARAAAIYGNEPAPDAPPPTFIHLKHATFLLPGQSLPSTNRPIWWRGRLSCVQGFIFGRMGDPAES